jgi:hypothetical protein
MIPHSFAAALRVLDRQSSATKPLRQLIAGSLLAALVMSLSVVLASPVQAAEPWVTRAEYRAVHVGMTRARVHRIFDTNGVVTLKGGMHPGESRHYRMKVDGKKRCIAIDYGRKNGVWRMEGKSRPFPPFGANWRCHF